MYIKIFDANDTLTGAEQLTDPIFVRWQTSNGAMVSCERADAQGVIGADGNSVYLVNGAMPRGEKEPYAVEITQAEYEEIIAGFDPEDETPAVPDPEQPPLTRAELTSIVKEQAGQIQMLTDALLEMSEVVYE